MHMYTSTPAHWPPVHRRICLHFVKNNAGSNHVSFSNQKDAKITLIYSTKHSGILVWHVWKTCIFESETTVWLICAVHNDGSVIMYCSMNRGGIKHYIVLTLKRRSKLPWISIIHNVRLLTYLRSPSITNFL